MNTTTSLNETGALARPASTPTRRVVDAPTRMFHWLFALSFLGAYLTADGERWRLLHVTLGYTLAGLLAFRVVYGLIGPRPARLSLLLRKLGGWPQWVQSALSTARSTGIGAVNWRQGQYLLMALAVVSLLVLVLPLTLSGYATYNEWGGDWLEELHELVGNAFLLVVLGHLALIAALSVLRRKNMAMHMISGRAEGRGPDLVPRNHGWLAALLLAAVLAFWAWEWQQSPNGLISAAAWSQSAQHGRDDD